MFKIQTQHNNTDDKIVLKEILNFQFKEIKEKHSNKRLVIILDAIDQLNPSDYDLDWLIESIPTNVKMIYSTLPNYENILDQLRRKKFGEINYIEVTRLDISLSFEILSDWLKKSKRSISEIQMNYLKAMFKTAELYPLYIKLIFDIVIKWPSFYEPDNKFLKCSTIDRAIKYLFNLYENEHNKTLFSKLIFYMSSFSNGISENEIEDILSIDDEVLYDIFEFHVPPIRKFPQTLVIILI